MAELHKITFIGHSERVGHYAVLACGHTITANGTHIVGGFGECELPHGAQPEPELPPSLQRALERERNPEPEPEMDTTSDLALANERVVEDAAIDAIRQEEAAVRGGRLREARDAGLRVFDEQKRDVTPSTFTRDVPSPAELAAIAAGGKGAGRSSLKTHVDVNVDMSEVEAALVTFRERRPINWEVLIVDGMSSAKPGLLLQTVLNGIPREREVQIVGNGRDSWTVITHEWDTVPEKEVS